MKSEITIENEICRCFKWVSVYSSLMIEVHSYYSYLDWYSQQTIDVAGDSTKTKTRYGNPTTGFHVFLGPEITKIDHK